MHKRFDYISRRGFTIVELLIVVIVIAILAAIVIVAYSGIVRHSKVSIVQQSLARVSQAAMAYKVTDASENYPTSLAVMNVSSSTGPVVQYSVSNTGTKSYCITATLDDVSYFYSSTTNTTTEGYCPGHSPVIYKTAAGWNSYPIPWSTGTDHGYGPYYGVYYPSTLHADNSGSLTLFNPYSVNAGQGGVNSYFWCRDTSSNAVSTVKTGSTFGTFSATVDTNTVSWSCPAGSVLYAYNIGTSAPSGTPDSQTGATKAKTWYAPTSPNYTASSAYAAPQVTADPAGWTTTPIAWGTPTYSDLGYGPYYAVFIQNDPSKVLTTTNSGTLQLYDPYAATRGQGGVNLYYWCKDSTTGLVRSYQTASLGTFNSGATTNQTTWSCTAGSKLWAAYLGGSSPSSYYPNEASPKDKYWFAGDSLSAYPAYIESVRTLYGE